MRFDVVDAENFSEGWITRFSFQETSVGVVEKTTSEIFLEVLYFQTFQHI